MLEADASGHEHKGQVVVEEVRGERHHDDPPAGESDRDEKEPREPDSAEVAPRASVESPEV